MSADWLPEWWVQSPAFQWLAGPGRWLLPSLIHACCLGIEISSLRVYGRLPYKQRSSAERSVWIVMILHMLAFVMTMAATDMGFFYYYGSGLWGVLTILLAASAIRRTKHAEPDPEPDPYARHLRPDFAKLRADKLPERTP